MKKRTWLGMTALGAMGLARGVLWYRQKVNGPFEPTRFIWSRGLALWCDHNGGVDFVKRQRGGRPALRFAPDAYDSIQDGDLVWVRHIALPQFVEEVLPRVRSRFGLVTGDEDWAIPSGYPQAQRILASDRVVHWFTQNFDGTDDSGKVSPIPIGLDFHTISNRRKWGHWPATPAEQEAELDDLIAHMPPTGERRLAVHADFHFNKHKQQQHGDSRDDVESLLRNNPLVTFQGKKVSRLELWKDKTRYAFVVSPHGNGLDCHRTWESLVLGTIVIVERSSLDPLYQGLPVVIVDDWAEITRPNLERWLEQHAPSFGSNEVQTRLTNAYWVAHMRRVLGQAMGGPVAETEGAPSA
ncbi:MAG: hypothetical protein JRI68_22265 [Deltaproteobacteria bacterium]|nr:hypothetical protein [Deltaproteobacteria bacterium]